MSTQPVNFVVDVVHGSDTDKVRKDLESLANDFTFVSKLDLKNVRMTLLQYTTSQASYESVFNTTLNYTTRTINRSGPQVTPKKVSDWEESRPASVPSSLAGRVNSITLNIRRYAC